MMFRRLILENNFKKIIKISYVFICFLFLFNGKEISPLDLNPTEKFFINDYANIISSSIEDEIYSMGVQLYEKTTSQVVAVTVDNIGNYPIEDFSIKLAEHFGIGDKNKDNGILLIFSKQEGNIRIEVGYGLEGAITDSYSGRILDMFFLDSARQGDFSKAFLETYKALTSMVYKEYGLEYSSDYIIENIVGERSDLKYGILGILVILIFLFASRFGGGFSSIGRRRPFISGGFSGGGFSGGGFSGGGSFGGGGFSGGGGSLGGGGFSGGGGSFGGGGSSRKLIYKFIICN